MTPATGLAPGSGSGPQPGPGRVAVVTGAASGIGAALALAYAREGTRTVIATFPGDPHDPNVTAAAVAQAGGECVVAEVDVRDAAQVEALAQRALTT